MSKLTLFCRLTSPLLLALPAVAQGADLCSEAGDLAAISGASSFPFDTTQATQDGPGDQACFKFGTSDIDNDVWFAWTPDAYCDYTFETCGGTTGDTKIALYDTPFCSQVATSIIDCNDDTCGLQSSVSASQLEAGRTYLIRVGSFPGAAGTTGMLTISSDNCSADLVLLIAGKDATAGRVLVYDNSGSIDDPDFIMIPHPPGPGERFPVEPGLSDPPFPGPVGFGDFQEIWTSDKTFDTIYRHPNEGGAGCSLGEFEGTLDDPRGYAFADGKLYVTALSGGLGVLHVFDQDSTLLQTISLGYEPWDVMEYQGELLISNSTNGTIEAMSFAGVPQGTFSVVPPGFTPIQNPKQLSISPDGFVLAAGQGIFAYGPNGTQLGSAAFPFLDVLNFPVAGGTSCVELNGVYQLPSGFFVWTCNEGVFLFNLSGPFSAPAPGSPPFNAQFVRFFARPTPPPQLGTNYCVSLPNSTGCSAIITPLVSTSVAANDLVLHAETVPLNQFGIFFYSATQTQFPFGNGFLCVGPDQIGRLDVVNSGPHGILEYAVDYSDPPFPAVQIVPGSTWNFQSWYRDPNGGGAFFSLSDAVEILFSP